MAVREQLTIACPARGSGAPTPTRRPGAQQALRWRPASPAASPARLPAGAARAPHAPAGRAGRRQWRAWWRRPPQTLQLEECPTQPMRTKSIHFHMLLQVKQELCRACLQQTFRSLLATSRTLHWPGVFQAGIKNHQVQRRCLRRQSWPSRRRWERIRAAPQPRPPAQPPPGAPGCAPPPPSGCPAWTAGLHGHTKLLSKASCKSSWQHWRQHLTPS